MNRIVCTYKLCDINENLISIIKNNELVTTTLDFIDALKILDNNFNKMKVLKCYREILELFNDKIIKLIDFIPNESALHLIA